MGFWAVTVAVPAAGLREQRSCHCSAPIPAGTESALQKRSSNLGQQGKQASLIAAESFHTAQLGVKRSNVNSLL